MRGGGWGRLQSGQFRCPPPQKKREIWISEIPERKLKVNVISAITVQKWHLFFQTTNRIITVCPRSSDPFLYSNLLHAMGH